jgi:alpha 1,3-mannosyltransferase
MSLQLPSFSPAPRKEGRFHPFSRHRQRHSTVRIIIGVVAVVFCYIVLTSIPGPPADIQGAPKTRVTESEKPNRSIFESQSPLEYESKSPVPPQTSTAESVSRLSTKLAKPTSEPSSEPEIKKSKPKSKVTVTKVESKYYNDVTAEEHERFENALSKVLNMLPDEMHVRELLRPVEGTGKEKLREMGLRSRAYKRFFEAWETLHLVPAGGSYYVRDDIVQYLRSRHVSDDDTSLAQTIRSYETFRSLLRNMAELLFPWTSPYFSDHMSLHTHFHQGGRGIVLTAGDEQAPFLLTSINLFRKLGCKLPIEIMYLGDSDLGEDFRSELEALPGVVTRDLSQMVDDKGWQLKGWAGKPFAMLLSSFREVIFIDADAMFFKDPEVLFEDPDYVETGALFFHDRLMMAESKKRWLQQTLPKPISKQARQSRFWTGQSGHQQESGVVVVDKWRHFIPMLLVTRMNGPDRDGNKEQGITGVYDMVYGEFGMTQHM